MEVTILGCDGSWPGPGGSGSSYLVGHDGSYILLDLGGGTMGRVQEHVGLAELGGVFITHPHTDHFADLYPLSIASFYGRRLEPGLPLHAAEILLERARAILTQGTREAWEHCFDERPMDAGASAILGPFTVTSFAMNHAEGSLGFRVEAGGSSLSYTGDTGPCEEVVNMAKSTDLFVCEATWQDGREGGFHMTARQAGDSASRAGARLLLLTHLEPGTDPEVSAAQAAAAFGGEILVARPGDTLVVPGS